MRLTRSITMTNEGSSPLLVAVTTGTSDPDARPSPLPIQLSQGSDEDPQTIYMTWEQFEHVGAGTHRAVTGESYLEPPHGF